MFMLIYKYIWLLKWLPTELLKEHITSLMLFIPENKLSNQMNKWVGLAYTFALAVLNISQTNAYMRFYKIFL